MLTYMLLLFIRELRIHLVNPYPRFPNTDERSLSAIEIVKTRRIV